MLCGVESDRYVFRFIIVREEEAAKQYEVGVENGTDDLDENARWLRGPHGGRGGGWFLTSERTSAAAARSHEESKNELNVVEQRLLYC